MGLSENPPFSVRKMILLAIEYHWVLRLFSDIYTHSKIWGLFFFPMGIYCQGARPAEQFFHLFSEGKCAKKFATYPEESIRQAMKECILQDIYM